MIKVLKRTLLTLSLVLFVTPSYSDMSDFNGFYVSIGAGVAGAELDGKYTDNDSNVTKAKGGGVAQAAIIELGYNYAVDTYGFGLGVHYIPGEVTLGKSDTEKSAEDLTVEGNDFYTVYAQMSVAVSEETALYVKAGASSIDLSYTGASNITGTKPGDLDGSTFAIGSMSSIGNGMFIKSEAGWTEYDTLTLTDINTNSGSDSGDITADPTAVYGMISVGMTF